MKNNEYILACDLDGTLLNSNSEVSKENIQAIKEFTSLGHHFIISSGRPIFRALVYADILDLKNTNNYLVCLNGGLIIDLKDNSVLYEEFLKDEEVKEILDFSKETDTDCLVYNLNVINSFSGEKTQEYISKVEGIINVSSKDELYKKKDVHKIIFLGTSEELEIVKEKSFEKHFDEKYNVVKSTPHLLEFLPKVVSKGDALDKIREALNIPLENTFAIGDEENDLSLLLHSGVKVTLENGNPKIKEISDIITPSNDNNGVSYLIKEIILKK